MVVLRIHNLFPSPNLICDPMHKWMYIIVTQLNCQEWMCFYPLLTDKGKKKSLLLGTVGVTAHMILQLQLCFRNFMNRKSYSDKMKPYSDMPFHTITVLFLWWRYLMGSQSHMKWMESSLEKDVTIQVQVKGRCLLYKCPSKICPFYLCPETKLLCRSPPHIQTVEWLQAHDERKNHTETNSTKEWILGLPWWSSD